MAELSNGPLGSISGKVGNMVASNWRDISYLRGLGKKSKKEPTDSQKEVQMRLTMLQSFLSPIKGILNLGFANKDTRRETALNIAVRTNMIAFAGTYPELNLDYSKMVIADGPFCGVLSLAVAQNSPGTLSFTWNAVLKAEGVDKDDKVHVVIYHSGLNLHIAFREVAVREAMQAEIEIPTEFEGAELHCYVFVTSKLGNKSSKSNYISFSS